METTLATFEKDVIEASKLVPVLVDFWAPWCGPCRSLGPLLEKLEDDYAGRFRLVKINSDENPELSAHFKIRSIPYVVAFADGAPVDHFTGALPEGELRRFIDRLIPNPQAQQRRIALQAIEAGDRAAAYDALHAALALDPGFDEARLDLIELLIDEARIDDALTQVERLSPKTTQGIDARYNALKTRLDAAHAAAQLPAADALADRVEQNPADLEARFDLASRYIAERRYESALEHLLQIVVRDRKFRDDIGRKTMLSVFDLAAEDAALVARWRKKLSSALY
ncbi:MAG: tetratricopeptide repeat protein [Janthinobacterium lividum]